MLVMARIKKKLARKAVRSTAKHTAHGAASKLKREPLRSATLLALGCVVGGFAGWMLARSGHEPDSGGDLEKEEVRDVTPSSRDRHRQPSGV
jgi:hypothetical protein